MIHSGLGLSTDLRWEPPLLKAARTPSVVVDAAPMSGHKSIVDAGELISQHDGTHRT